MIIRLKLEDTIGQIQNNICKALLPELKKYFKIIESKLKIRLRDIVTKIIKSSPEYNSLISGELRYELGVPDASSRIETIFNIWFSNIDVSIKQPKLSGNGISGKISISFIKSDLSDILSSDIATIIDSNTGSNVNWLEWLSVAGDKTIITDYDILVGPNPRSRTGQAIMKISSGKKWKVPSNFSGTLNSNWITRAIDSNASNIEQEIQNILQSAL